MAYRDPQVRRARDRERFQRRTAERIARGSAPNAASGRPNRSAVCVRHARRSETGPAAPGTRSSGPPASRAGTRRRRGSPAAATVAGRPPSAAPGGCARTAGSSRPRPMPACANRVPGSGARPNAPATRRARPPASPMAGATPGSAERWRARRVGGACANASKRACAPDAGTGPRPRTARPASRAVKPARPPSANSMPRGAPPVSAPVAGSGPSTAPLPAHRAPCARAGAIRRRRTQPPDGSTPGGGPRGNAPTAESLRRARRGASPVRSGPGSAPNTSAGYRSGRRNTP